MKNIKLLWRRIRSILNAKKLSITYRNILLISNYQYFNIHFLPISKLKIQIRLIKSIITANVKVSTISSGTFEYEFVVLFKHLTLKFGLSLIRGATK